MLALLSVVSALFGSYHSLDRLQDKKKARAAMPAGLFSGLPVPARPGISLERTLLSAPSGLVHITRRD
jgi:hypothetical protein